MGRNGSRGVFMNKQHLKLATYFFPAEGKARALALMVHGHGCSFFHEYGHSQARCWRLLAYAILLVQIASDCSHIGTFESGICSHHLQ